MYVPATCSFSEEVKAACVKTAVHEHEHGAFSALSTAAVYVICIYMCVFYCSAERKCLLLPATLKSSHEGYRWKKLKNKLCHAYLSYFLQVLWESGEINLCGPMQRNTCRTYVCIMPCISYPILSRCLGSYAYFFCLGRMSCAPLVLWELSCSTVGVMLFF